MRRSLGYVLAASIALTSVSLACAEDAPAAAPTDQPAAKPKPAKPKAPASVTFKVFNKRNIPLKSLTALASGSSGDPKKVIGVVNPGKEAVGHVARTKDCQYDLHGDYDDGAVFEASGVDLCKGGPFNLTE